MKLTVMVPVYNEVKTILQAIKDVEKIKVPDKEVIIIDNCSTDGTKELLQGLKLNKGYQIIYNKKNLVAGSFVIVRKLAKGEYIYPHHSDLEYDSRDAMRMLEIAEQGSYDVVLGSRLKNSQESIWSIIKNRPASLASIICTALINRWYGKNFTDIIGTRLYRTSSIRKIPMTDFGHGSDFECVSRMCRRGFKMAEVAVSYQPRSWKEGKKIRPYHIINALLAMFRVRCFG